MYIDEQSYKCMLGSQSRELEIFDGIYKWKVCKKLHIIKSRPLIEFDIEILKQYTPFIYNYFSLEDVQLLKKNFGEVESSRKTSVEIELQNLDFVGIAYKGIRGSINKAKKLSLTIQDNFNDIQDIKDFVKKWGDGLGDKYFQDHSSKNVYYFSKNWHKDCISIFCYIEKDLVSFAVLSKPIDGYSSYICGKALSDKYMGLSEFTDMLIYKKGIDYGVKIVNLGLASKGLLFYKMKFPGSRIQYHYDGKVL